MALCGARVPPVPGRTAGAGPLVGCVVTGVRLCRQERGLLCCSHTMGSIFCSIVHAPCMWPQSWF